MALTGTGLELYWYPCIGATYTCLSNLHESGPCPSFPIAGSAPGRDEAIDE